VSCSSLTRRAEFVASLVKVMLVLVVIIVEFPSFIDFNIVNELIKVEEKLVQPMIDEVVLRLIIELLLMRSCLELGFPP